MAPVAPHPHPAPTSLTSFSNAAPASVPAAAPPSTLLTRSQRWIEENQRLLLLGAAVAAAGGVGWYLYSRPPPRVSLRGGEGEGSAPGSPTAGGAGASGKSKKKKNKKKGGAGAGAGSGLKEGFLKGEGGEGPLVEEVSPEERARIEKARAEEKAKAQAEAAGHLDGVPSTSDEIEALSEEQRNSLGTQLKERGNKLYSKRDFVKAVECYTKAIEISVRKDAVFYSNRAACYTNFSPPQYEKCVADCNEALALDHHYVKALKRRATALESLGRDEEAVRDFTATTIIERFTDEQAAASVERCLKSLAAKKSKDILASREPRLPSPTFISSYLGAFREHPKPKLPTDEASVSQGDRTLDLAFDALEACDYTHALSFVNEAIEQKISTKQAEAEAYNLRGTFKFLVGDSTGAKADLEKALDLVPEFVQAWVKIASVHMELGDPASAFGDFEAAIRHNERDPDIYYHRGQVYFIMGEFDKALADYNKSTELDGSFIFTHVQAAVAQYKQGLTAPSMAAFRRIMKQFPDRGEPSNYYGELLLDQQKFPEAVERFDRAIELDRARKPRNVLPLVNKSLCIFQWRQDAAQAEKLCREALDIDPECDVAVATLAQLSLQQGKTEEAIGWFERSGGLARTEGELVNALTYEYASRAQLAFLQNYPEFAERLQAIAASA